MSKNILNEKLVQNTDFPFYFYLLQIFTYFDKSRYIALEYFMRIIYDIPFFGTCITELDISTLSERLKLKANKCQFQEIQVERNYKVLASLKSIKL